MDSLTSSICRSCRTRLTSTTVTRAFSTSLRHQIIPPESPAYIDIPSTHQTELPFPRREKGILPVPRELFPANRPDKPSKEYIDNLTKSPLPKNQKSLASLSEHGKYKHRMAQLRKKHVREGLTELYKRKSDTTARFQAHTQRRQTERARLISQPPREDARLTNNTVPSIMKPGRSATPIADDLAVLKAQQERKLVNYQAAVAAKSAERLDALHTLYMNARTFITTEQQLAEAIADQFDRSDIFTTDMAAGKSMWNLGPPDTIKDMIANSQTHDSASSKLLATMRRDNTQGAKNRYARDQERMKKIAEKLSGGKI